MRTGIWTRRLAALAGVAVTTLGAASGSFQLVENFDALAYGPIDGRNGWMAENVTSAVTPDPIGGDNHVLAVVTESTHLYKGLLLADGTARMLFLRFRASGQLSYSLGMSDVAGPYRFDHFESELGMTNASTELRINDAGVYDVLAALEPDTWYNCWILIDNTHDDSQVWLHARGLMPATAGDQLDADGQTVFQFRNTTAGDLINFFLKTGGGSGLPGPLFLDEIHLEDTDALNLENPVVPPYSAAQEPALGTELLLAPAQPNPFHGGTTLRFSFPAAAAARLCVLDLQGRCVARLSAGTASGGEQEVVWRGCDARGRPVAAGTYFVRLEASGRVLTRSVVLTK